MTLKPLDSNREPLPVVLVELCLGPRGDRVRDRFPSWITRLDRETGTLVMITLLGCTRQAGENFRKSLESIPDAPSNDQIWNDSMDSNGEREFSVNQTDEQICTERGVNPNEMPLVFLSSSRVDDGQIVPIPPEALENPDDFFESLGVSLAANTVQEWAARESEELLDHVRDSIEHYFVESLDSAPGPNLPANETWFLCCIDHYEYFRVVDLPDNYEIAFKFLVSHDGCRISALTQNSFCYPDYKQCTEQDLGGY